MRLTNEESLSQSIAPSADWTYQPKPKRQRVGAWEKSSFYEVTKNANGEYVTRHINYAALQQLPQSGKSAIKSVPFIHPGNTGYHYLPSPIMHADPSAGASYGGAHQPGVYLGE